MSVQQTLIIIKPDGLVKSLTGNILSRLAEAKLTIMGAKVVRVTRQQAAKHYEHLKDMPFFEELISYIVGDVHKTHRVIALVYQGEDAISKIRDIVGDTNPEKANPVSIRGAYGRITTTGVFENVVRLDKRGRFGKRKQTMFDPDEIIEDIYPVTQITLKDVQKNVWA